MPNWCTNSLEVSGDADDIARFRAAVHTPITPKARSGKWTSEWRLTNLCPIPGGEEAATLDAQVGHWGTKWGDCYTDLVDESEDSLLFSFDTAWGPMLEAVEQTARIFPNLLITNSFYEGGMGFRGSISFRGNEIIESFEEGDLGDWVVPDDLLEYEDAILERFFDLFEPFDFEVEGADLWEAICKEVRREVEAKQEAELGS